MSIEDTANAINAGDTCLGIELGSTRIKAALIDKTHRPIAQGSFDWENRLEDGMWTYRLSDVETGLQACFRSLAANVESQYGVPLERVGALGISGMMHGYLVFDKNGRQIAPFRTWRNNNTGTAAARLSELFQFNIPLRWSIAHLYQAILNGEAHVKDIDFMTTLSGYVHWRLTGERVLGAGDASGMFPLDSGTNDYHAGMLKQFDELAAGTAFDRKVSSVLPRVLAARADAGECAGKLTAEGACFLDPSGRFQAGIPLCPPEGDAGTGMVATNSVAPRTGNVSAGTSIFAMVVLEKELSATYPEIDMVTTPAGRPAAMAHCNNCTTDMDAWMRLVRETAALVGAKVVKGRLYDALYEKALEGEADCGGLLSYNYVSGEPVTGVDEGRPLLARLPGGRFTLSNLMRTLLFSAMASLKIGMDTLTVKEQVRIDRLMGHGGLFKTKVVGQRLMAAALNIPVAVMDSAAEGGAWGIALLAAYLVWNTEKEPLEGYLAEHIFTEGMAGKEIMPDSGDVEGFERFMTRYTAGLVIEKTAAVHFR
jgi:sugar (pentulose or hexulose) kinase